ncbi:MAG: isocitrate lyase/PEP mutase family protein [Hyphomicrobiaceae bacterium]
MTKLRELIAGEMPVDAPLVLNPMMARLAEAAGFQALYLGGGSTGYLKCVTEANLNLSEMCQAALDIKTVSSLPLILDGACGWGDPMHMHRTIGMSETAGFEAIEIEDQILPKRAHHHIGIEHVIPAELMCEKIKECLAARRSPDFLIIARTNATRMHGLDEALRRAEAFRKAGADMLLVLAKTPDQVKVIGEKVGGPMVLLASGDAVRASGLSRAELGRLGYKLIIDASTPLMAAHKAWRDTYAAMARDEPAPSLGPGGAKAEQDEVHKTIGLDRMLAIERRTVER